MQTDFRLLLPFCKMTSGIEIKPKSHMLQHFENTFPKFIESLAAAFNS